MKTVYTKDLTNNKLFVKREFAASLDKVWEAWTNPEILDQWWAPKPWKAVTKIMDFKEGGAWLYYMLGPDGEKNWCKADYKKIEHLKSYEGLDYFCDENGNESNELPSMFWKVNFSPSENGTIVEVEITYPRKDDLEKIVEMGFEAGFRMAHENLDELLLNL